MWDYPNPHTLSVVPQAGDIDGLNHTNNAVYVKWCEQVAWAHSEHLGLNLEDYRRLDRAMAIRRSEYDYLLPTYLGEALTLGTWLVGEEGNVSMERRFQVIRDSDGVARPLESGFHPVEHRTRAPDAAGIHRCLRLRADGGRRLTLSLRMRNEYIARTIQSTWEKQP